MGRVLVIDGDAGARADLARSLTEAGHEIELAAGARAGAALARASRPDLVILDLSLPDGDGAEVCAVLRTEPAMRRTPVLVLTERTAEDERVRAFEAGVDDYVCKPFSVRELLLRVRALLRRRGSNPPADVVEVGALRIDRAARRVTYRGDAIELSKRELDLLIVLAERRGRVQTRSALVTDVWGGETDTTGEGARVVDTTIKRLRKKLGPMGHAIETVRGAGYRFAPPDADEL